jgi:L-fucose mutarotase
MLKGIPPLISPDFMKILMEMGHGDDIVLVNANFPAASNARRLVRCDGSTGVEVLEAVMRFFPLDNFIASPVTLMDVASGETTVPEIWSEFQAVITRSEPWVQQFETVKRFEFYERARQAYAIVATGERRRYANIILRKGIIEPGVEI